MFFFWTFLSFNLNFALFKSCHDINLLEYFHACSISRLQSHNKESIVFNVGFKILWDIFKYDLYQKIIGVTDRKVATFNASP